MNSLSIRNDMINVNYLSTKNVGEMSASAVSTVLCSESLFKHNDLLMLSNLILKHMQ